MHNTIFTIDDKEEVLKQVEGFEVVRQSNGWLAKHTDAMVVKTVDGSNQMMAYFMYYPTREMAIENYFSFVTSANTQVWLMGPIRKFVFEDGVFNTVA